ncbi:MAG: aspartate--tRNA ligase [Candidatus Jacksonbacteria bacterium]
MYRTHTCGQLNKEHISQTVQLAGWVNSRRDHGGLIFIDLRDRYGLTQCTFDQKIDKKAWETADKVRGEYVLQIEGNVRARPEEMINPNLDTGDIEVAAKKITILTRAKTPPFEIEWRSDIDDQALFSFDAKHTVAEEVRLKYRYLDLRRKRMLANLKLRHKLVNYIREYLNQEGFLEIETPILTKSTPEGARDYIVPARLHPGQFYALPQSPQQYKQLLMLSGMDRYYQIARCFRDEDQRGDRQPEFTQLDIEMSFVERDDVLNLTENLFKSVFKRLIDDELMNKKIVLDKPWPRLNWEDVMLKYGTDRPDLRFGLEIVDISKVVQNTEFQIFSESLKSNGAVRAINATGADKAFSRGDIDELTQFIKKLGGRGLAYFKVKTQISKLKSQNHNSNMPHRQSAEEAELKTNKKLVSEKKFIFKGQELALYSPIVKFLNDDEIAGILEAVEAKPGDIVLFGAGEKRLVEETLGALRVELGKRLKLIDENELKICWVIDFPLFEQNQTDNHYAPSHHMFTSPNPADIPLLDSDPYKVKSWQYDLVMNGFEVGGGSIRIHDPALQEKIFDLIGFDEAKKKEFSHILRAFQYGAPPHGGIAPGIDRIAMLLAGEPNIREVMAFPKSQKAEDLMMSAPSQVDAQQLKEAHIKLDTDSVM